MKIEVLERDDQRVRYRLLDDAGNEVAQMAEPIEPHLKAARRRRKSLEHVLAEKHGATPVSRETPVASAETPDRQLTLGELGDYFEAKDHEHDYSAVFAPMQHQHRGELELRQSLNTLADQVGQLTADTTGSLRKLERHAEHHDHDVPAHAHARIDAQIEALRADIRALEGRGVPEHGHADYMPAEIVASHVNGLRMALTTLQERLEQVAHQVAAMPAPAPPVPDEQIEAVVAKLLAERRTELMVREISSQKVDGKRRFVVEEE